MSEYECRYFWPAKIVKTGNLELKEPKPEVIPILNGEPFKRQAIGYKPICGHGVQGDPATGCSPS